MGEEGAAGPAVPPGAGADFRRAMEVVAEGAGREARRKSRWDYERPPALRYLE